MAEAAAAAATWVATAIGNTLVAAGANTVTVIAATKWAYIAAYTVSSLAIQAGLSYAIDTVTRPKQKPLGSELNFNIDAAYPREMIIGQRLVGGSMVARYSRGSNLYNAHMVVQLADHPCTELSKVYDGGRLVQSTPLTHGVRTEITAYSGSGGARVWMTWHDGRPGQTADSDLVTKSAQDPEVVAGKIPAWSSEHVGAGCAYVHVEVQWDSDILTAIPQFTFLVKGAPLYDRRLDGTAGGTGDHRLDDPSTWEYSTNARVALDHYLLGYRVEDEAIAFGIGLSPSEVPYADFEYGADLCDEDVETGTGEAIETIKRYAANGVISAADYFEDAVESFQLQMAARVVDLGGRIGVIGAEEKAVTVSLTDDDLVKGEPLQYADKLPFSDLFGSVTATISDPANLYQPTPLDPLIGAYNALPDGGEAQAMNLSLPYEVHTRRAQRLTSAWFERESLQPRLAGVFMPKAWKLEPGDWFEFTSARLQVTAAKFEVIDIIKHDDFTVTITARAIDPAFLAFSNDNDPDLSVPPDVAPVSLFLDPPEFDVAVTTLEAGGVIEPALEVTLTSDETIAREIVYEYAVWDSGADPGEQVVGPTLVDSAHVSQIVTKLRKGILPSTDYAVRAKAKAGRRESPWTDWSTPVTTGATYAVGSASSVPWSGVTGSGKPTDNADVTAANTAAGFTGQGALATLSTINSSGLMGAGVVVYTALASTAVRLGTNITRADGSTSLTDALAVTSLGTAAAFTGQGALATLSSIASSALLGAGVVTASKFGVGDGSNLIDDPNAADADYWTTSGGTWVIGSTDSEVTTGLGAERGFKSPAGDGSTTQVFYTAQVAAANKTLVEPGKSYRIAAKVLAKSGCTFKPYLQINWFKQDGSAASTAQGVVAGPDYRTSAVGSDTVSALEAMVTAPADAYSARFLLVAQTSTTQANAGRCYFALPRMNRAASLGKMVTLEDGTTAATNALLQTSLGTAAAFVSQGALATLNTINSTSLMGAGVVAYTALTSTAVRLGTNIVRNDGSTSLTDALAVTSLGTAAAITGQGALATKATIDSSGLVGAGVIVYTALSATAVRLGTNITRADGSTSLTDALAVTSLGTAAAFASQGALATLSTINSSGLMGSGVVLYTALSSTAVRLGTNITRNDGSTSLTDALAVTSLGTAAAFTGQGALAVKNTIDSSGLMGSGVVIHTALSTTAVRLGTNITKADGSTSLTDALAVTSLGTAAAIAGQGALATKATIDSTGLVGASVIAYTALTATAARLGVNVTLNDGSTSLSDALAVTSLGTAAAIASQGALATLAQVNLGASGRVYRDDGSTRVTDALAITALGTAAAISGQGALATKATIDSSTLMGAGVVIYTALSATAVRLGTNITRNDGSTALTDALAVTSLGTAAAITGQGWGATASEPNASNQQAAFASRRAWDFDSGVSIWDDRPVSGPTISATGGIVTLSAGGGNSTYIYTPSNAIMLAGVDIPIIRARMRRTDAAPSSGWVGNAYYETSGHGFDIAYYRAISAPTAAQNEWFIAEWDMTALTAGGSDYTANTIQELRLDLSSSTSAVFEIDWIAVGRRGLDPLGLRAITDSADQTSANTAAAFTGQGALATLSTINSTSLMGSAVVAYTALTSTAVRLGTNITRNDGSTSLTDALAVTSLGTAAAITGQGALATKATIDSSGLVGASVIAYTALTTTAVRLGVNITRNDGSTSLSDALAVTSLGTAAAIASQGALATKATIDSTSLMGAGVVVYTALASTAVRLGTNITRSDGSTSLTDALAVTSLGTAAAFSGQGALATLSTINSSSLLSSGVVTATKQGIGDSSNLVQDPDALDSAYWSFSAGGGGGSWTFASTDTEVTTGLGAPRGWKTPAGNGDMVQRFFTALTASANYITVEPGKAYQLTARARVKSGFTQQCYLQVSWYKQDGSAASTSSSAVLGVDYRTTAAGADTSETIDGKVTAPADAYYARFTFVVRTSTTQANSGHAYFVAPRMRRTYALGTMMVREDGTTALTDALAVTSLGTASAITSQGGLATLSYVTLNSNVRLQNGSTVATDAMLVTSSGTASAIAGQGGLATTNFVLFSSTVRLADGTTVVTDAMVVTASGTAGAITGQGNFATNNFYVQTTEPSSPQNGWWWADTTDNLLKVRVSGAWTTVADITPAGGVIPDLVTFTKQATISGVTTSGATAATLATIDVNDVGADGYLSLPLGNFLLGGATISLSSGTSWTGEVVLTEQLQSGGTEYELLVHSLTVTDTGGGLFTMDWPGDVPPWPSALLDQNLDGDVRYRLKVRRTSGSNNITGGGLDGRFMLQRVPG